MYFIILSGNKNKEFIMDIYQKKRSFLKNSIWIVSLLIIFLCGSLIAAASDKKEVKDEEKNNIYNIHDRDMGKVTEDRIIYNRFGRPIGSVDEDGIIYNVSRIVVGKVEENGNVKNQSGTKMGSVNDDGEIFNVSKRKLGIVKNISDIKLIGGAARLIFLK